jgi:hypothetical protein
MFDVSSFSYGQHMIILFFCHGQLDRWLFCIQSAHNRSFLHCITCLVLCSWSAVLADGEQCNAWRVVKLRQLACYYVRLRLSRPWNDTKRSLFSAPKIWSAFSRVSYITTTEIYNSRGDLKLRKKQNNGSSWKLKVTTWDCLWALSSLMLARKAANCSYERRLLHMKKIETNNWCAFFYQEFYVLQARIHKN